MPLYNISSRTRLPDDVKQKVARKVVDVHCNLTGAPETFVNVIFYENVPLRPEVLHNIGANVRKGRTQEMNAELMSEMVEQVAELLVIPTRSIEITLFEVPAQWVMEGGEVLPEPGEEENCEWLKEQKEHAS